MSKSALKKPRFKPVFTKEQVYEIEAAYNESWGARRRVTMIVMTITVNQLIEGVEDLIKENNGDAFMDWVDDIKAYQAHLKAGIELTEASIARLLWVAQYVVESEAK